MVLSGIAIPATKFIGGSYWIHQGSYRDYLGSHRDELGSHRDEEISNRLYGGS